MAKIVGIANSSFMPKDGGRKVEGKTVYITDPIDQKKGEGISTDRFFLSAAKLQSLPFQPAVGMEVEVLYNKWGKVATLRLLDTDID